MLWSMAVGVYPGTFNPPTIAHVAVVEAARRHAGLTRVDLVVSAEPLGKDRPGAEALAARLRMLGSLSANRPWLRVGQTTARLIADIASGYDVLILGADKWAQVTDPHWYGGSPAARDEAVGRLPMVLVAPRSPYALPAAQPGRVEILDLELHHRAVSSSGVRAGRRDWLAPEVALSAAGVNVEQDRVGLPETASLHRMPGSAPGQPDRPLGPTLGGGGTPGERRRRR